VPMGSLTINQKILVVDNGGTINGIISPVDRFMNLDKACHTLPLVQINLFYCTPMQFSVNEKINTSMTDLDRILVLAGLKRLDEGVSLNGLNETVAFAVAVGEAYEAAPKHDPAADRHWIALKRHTIDVLLKRVQGSGIRIEYTEDDPYHEFGSSPKMMIRAMLYDILVNKRLLIYSGNSDDHPNFSPEENVIFRTIHDYFTHGKLLSTFKRNLQEVLPNVMKGEKPTPEQLAAAMPQISLTKGGNMGHSFTLRGELNAVSAHIRLAPKEAAPALFTEVAGQVCYYMCTAQFPPQKVAVLPGFDFKNIGKTLPGSEADRRKKEVMEILERSSPEDFIDLKIAARPKVKIARLLRNANSHDPYGR